MARAEEEKMITIDKNIPLKYKSKYDKYIKAMINMKENTKIVMI